MIFVEDYEDVLRDVGTEYLIFEILYVEDLKTWAGEKGIELSEPSQPMKLYTEDDKLIVAVQSEVTEEMLGNVMKGLNVRWALKSTASDPEKILNTTKKQLTYCFLKEYSKTVKDVGGDEMIEDEWVINQMEKLGFFAE